jgi:hypothetical protein
MLNIRVVQVGHWVGRHETSVFLLYVMVVKELSECGSVQVDCSRMEMFEPLDEKDRLVPVNF